MKNKIELVFGEGVKKGSLTINGKKRFMQTLQYLDEITEYIYIISCWNGFTAVGRLKQAKINGVHKNKYSLTLTTTSKNHKKVLIHPFYFTRYELKEISKAINIILEKTKSKKDKK